MIPAELLGKLEYVIRCAVRVKNTYKKRPGGEHRVFGGVNIIMCADFWQLHPVSGTFLASNPLDIPPGVARNATDLFWLDTLDSVRHLWRLTEKMRCTDPWYNDFLEQCRMGNLREEYYCYFHGVPTMTSPGKNCQCNADVEEDPILGPLRKSWKRAFLERGAVMADIVRDAESGCSECAAERTRRCRVIRTPSAVTSDLREHPFSGAPALYSFNVPRYFATNLRAREFAKQNNVQMTWCYARDIPLHPGDRELQADALDEKRFAWLRRHDQETAHIPSVYPLAVGMPIRLTESVDRSRQLYKGRKGVIHGWTLHPDCKTEEFEGELIVDRLPVVVYLLFPEVLARIQRGEQTPYPATSSHPDISRAILQTILGYIRTSRSYVGPSWTL